MDQSFVYLQVPGLLKAAELSQVDQLLATASFGDGRQTATGAARMVKYNQQLPADSPAAQQIGNIVLGAVSQSPLIQAAIMPKFVLPPLVSRYEPGMHYGWHVDSPLTGQAHTIRADVSITVFLTDPDTYEGGELVIQTEGGNAVFKMKKGDALVYPTTRLHVVNPVQQGVRLAAVTWMQCAVREASRRELLFQLSHVQQLMFQKDAAAPEYLLLQQVYSNLVRLWVEL